MHDALPVQSLDTLFDVSSEVLELLALFEAQIFYGLALFDQKLNAVVVADQVKCVSECGLRTDPKQRTHFVKGILLDNVVESLPVAIVYHTLGNEIDASKGRCDDLTEPSTSN